MTGPVSGFPDWQQYASWRGAIFIDTSPVIAANQGFPIGEFPMGNYASVRVRITTLAGGANLNLEGESDIFGSELYLVKKWVARADTSIHCVIPVPGTYIQMGGDSSVAAGWSGRVVMQPVNVSTDKVHYMGFNSVLNAYNVAINSGVTALHYPPVLLPGPAHLWANTDAMPQNVAFEIWTYDKEGARNELLGQYYQVTAGNANFAFEIPEKPWRMEVTNFTAGVRTYYFTVTSRGNLT